MTPAHAAPQIEIRECSSVGEYEECVRVQQVIWGDVITVPVPVFVVAQQTGGQILGAFDQNKLIGFTQAFTARRGGDFFLYSHIAAVLPEYRDRGVGQRLKLGQREAALRRGVKLIEWTFDPLEVKNAYFNLVKLGAVARRYMPNYYGVTGSRVHADMPTDRLVAEWWLESDRVKAALAGREVRPPGPDTKRIEIPGRLAELRERDRAGAAEMQAQVREQFQKWFAMRYAAMKVERREGGADYVLERAEEIGGLDLPE